jgi:hypothetical protein
MDGQMLSAAIEKTASYLCGKEGRESLVSEPHLPRSQLYVHPHPCVVDSWNDLIRACCTLGSGWRNQAYPVSAQILLNK